MKQETPMRNTLILFVIAAWLAAPALAKTFDVRDVKALREAFAAAEPGDVIRVAPGEYERAWLEGGGGSEDSPVVICGAEPERRPTFTGGKGEGMHLSGVSHVELRDLIITSDAGNGLNIDDGGKRDTPARGIVLRGLTVRGAAKGKGNIDGIKLSGLDDFHIVDCDVAGWGGQGCGVDMVGCHDGIIETSRFDGMNNGDRGIQAKGGSANIVVRDCTFRGYIERGVNLGGSTGEKYFRPPTFTGYEARDITVLHCIFVGGKTPVAFASSTNCTFHNNLIAYPDKWAVRILRENRFEGSQPTGRGTFTHNLIVWRGDALRPAVNVGPDVSADTFRFEGNWWYRTDAAEESRPSLPVAETDGVYGKNPHLSVNEDNVTLGEEAKAWRTANKSPAR